MTNASFSSPGIQLDFYRWFLKALCGGFLGLSLLPPAWAAPPRQARDTLQIYFVDVEGGQAMMAAMQTVSWLRPERRRLSGSILFC